MVIFHSYVNVYQRVSNMAKIELVNSCQFQMFQKANVPEKLWREVPILWILTN